MSICDKIYLTKATSRNLSIKIFFKISDMSKVRVLTYRFHIYNLQTKIVSFPNQEKLLKELGFSLAVSMNATTKNSLINHCPCPKYVVI